jgi:hypothetical protein
MNEENKIKLMEITIIRAPNGKIIYLKNAKQKAIKLLTQLIELVESDVYPLNDKEVEELTIHLYSLLQKKLQREVK